MTGVAPLTRVAEAPADLLPTVARLGFLVRAGHRRDLAVRHVRHSDRLARRRAPAAHRGRPAGHQPRVVRRPDLQRGLLHLPRPDAPVPGQVGAVEGAAGALGARSAAGTSRCTATRRPGPATPTGTRSRRSSRGEVVVFYPEATYTADPDGWPMRAKNGIGRIALVTGVPVIPVANWGTQDVLPPGLGPAPPVAAPAGDHRGRAAGGPVPRGWAARAPAPRWTR